MTKFTAEQADLIEFLLAEQLSHEYRASRLPERTSEQVRVSLEVRDLARSCLSVLNELREVL